MRISRWDAEFQRRVLELHQQGLSRREIARRLGCSHVTVSEALRLIGQPADNPPPSPSSQEEPPRQKAWEEVLAESVRRLPAPIPPPKITRWQYDEEEAVLLLSDVHVGQLTTLEATNGVYQHNLEVFRKQVGKLWKAIQSIVNIERPSVGWRRLHVFMLGDMVEGDNLREGMRIEAVATQQVMELLAELRNLFVGLLGLFEEIRVVGVPGNHGRITRRPGIGGSGVLSPVQNLDWLAYRFLQASLSDQERITWEFPQAMFAQVEVMGHRFVLEHGGSLRGGAFGAFGSIPYYACDRAMASLIGVLEERPDYYCVGHVHRSAILSAPGKGMILINGAWPATSEWALTERKLYTRPCQWMLSVHPKQGACMFRRLYLD